MTTPTSNLGLLKGVGSDNWRTYLKTSLASSLDVLDKAIGQVVNVKGYGAVGNGSTADDSAFAAAAAVAVTLGLEVYVPPVAPGLYYRLTSTWSWTSIQCRIRGDGYGSHIRIDAAAPAITCSTAGSEPSGGHIRNLRISSATAGASGILLSSALGVLVENVWMDGLALGIDVVNSANLTLRGLTMLDFVAGTGVGMRVRSVNGLFLSDVLYTQGDVLGGGADTNANAPDGFFLFDRSDGSVVTRVFATNIRVRHAGYGFKIVPTGASTRLDTMYVRNVYVQAGNESAVQITTDASAVVQNLEFAGGLFGDLTADGSGVNSDGVSINGVNARAIKLRNLLFGSVGGHGVVIGASCTASDFVEIDSCAFGNIGPTAAGSTDNTKDCVSIAAGSKGIIVRDCVLKQDGGEGLTHRYGINIAAGTGDRIFCLNNMVRGLTGSVNDGASGTEKVFVGAMGGNGALYVGTPTATSALILDAADNTSLIDFRQGGVAKWVEYISSSIWRLFEVGVGDRFRITPAGGVVEVVSGGFTVTAGKTTTAASATGGAGFRLPSGTAPTSPASGDFWYDGTNLKFRDGSTTRTLTWT